MGTERGKDSFVVRAWLVVFALGLDALMIVDVILPAVPRLVRVRKSSVERRRLQFYLLLRHLFTCYKSQTNFQGHSDCFQQSFDLEKVM